MKKEKKLSVTAIIFYVFAVLFLAYTAFSIFTAYEYVAAYIEQGSISYGSNFKDILALYMQQAGPYLVYSLLLYGVGYIIDGITKARGTLAVIRDTKGHEAPLAAVKAEPREVNRVQEPEKTIVKKEEIKEVPKEMVEDKKEPLQEAIKKEAKKETGKETIKKEAKKEKAETKPKAAKAETKPKAKKAVKASVTEEKIEKVK